jgi:excinuclease ABC subunit B
VADAREISLPKVAERKETYQDEMNREELIKIVEQEMLEASKAMDFERAAALRDQLFELRAAEPAAK